MSPLQARRARPANRAIGRSTLMPSCSARDLDTDAGIAAGGADANLVVLLAIEVGGIGIETADHAAHGVLDQLAVVHLVDVLALDALEDLGELARSCEAAAEAALAAAAARGAVLHASSRGARIAVGHTVPQRGGDAEPMPPSRATVVRERAVMAGRR